MGRKMWIVVVIAAVAAGFVGGRIGSWGSGGGQTTLRPGPYGADSFRAMYIETEMLGIVDENGERVAFLSSTTGPGSVYMELGPRKGPNMIRLDAGSSMGPQIRLSNAKDHSEIALHAWDTNWMSCQQKSEDDTSGIFLMGDGNRGVLISHPAERGEGPKGRTLVAPAEPTD